MNIIIIMQFEVSWCGYECFEMIAMVFPFEQEYNRFVDSGQVDLLNRYLVVAIGGIDG